MDARLERRDEETPAQTKMSLATKQCPHTSHCRRHNRNQHGFTIHCAKCNCRLLFAKRFDIVRDENGVPILTERTQTAEKGPTGTASQRKFLIKTLQQLNDQNSPDAA